ncbi:MAG: glycosyltransferase family 2 protein [Planctomycetaceae bacterium]|jgi:hypothetical protein|nr:glycosyltransferase family 2 protein [Planctomycetaceae bacterium]
MQQVYLTLAAIVRDQEHYIKEWLAFHYLTGFERFVIVLHKCNDTTEERIRELPFQEKIHIHRVVNDEQYVQLGTYLWILNNYGQATRWMTFLDSDEFLFGTKENDLKRLLTDYEAYGGVLSHWLLFGSNNHAVRPQGLSIEAFAKRAPDNDWNHYSFKMLIQPQYFQKFLSPHLAKTVAPTVREHFDIADSRWIWRGDKSPTWDVFRINHYHTRSMEDWVARYKRGQCNDPYPCYHYGSEAFKSHDYNNVNDACILRFAKPLKLLLETEL